MSISKRTFVASAAFSMISAPVFAQFGALGGLLGGGSKSAAVDLGKVEATLNDINQINSLALSLLSEALGDKESAAKAAKNGEDIKNGKIGLSESTSVVSDMSAQVKAQMEKFQSEGKKLDASSGTAAANALLPVVLAIPLWKVVIDGVKSLDASSAMRFAGLVQVAPKVPVAAKGTLDMLQAGVAYLTYSGVDTKKLASELSDKAKSIT